MLLEEVRRQKSDLFSRPIHCAENERVDVRRKRVEDFLHRLLASESELVFCEAKKTIDVLHVDGHVLDELIGERYLWAQRVLHGRINGAQLTHLAHNEFICSQCDERCCAMRFERDDHVESTAELPKKVDERIPGHRHPTRAVQKQVNLVLVPHFGQMAMEYGKDICGYVDLKPLPVCSNIRDNGRAPRCFDCANELHSFFFRHDITRRNTAECTEVRSGCI